LICSHTKHWNWQIMALHQAVVFHQLVVSCALAALTAIGGPSLGREKLLNSLQMREPLADYDAATSSLVAARSTINGFSNTDRQLGNAMLVTGIDVLKYGSSQRRHRLTRRIFPSPLPRTRLLIGHNFRRSSREREMMQLGVGSGLRRRQGSHFSGARGLFSRGPIDGAVDTERESAGRILSAALPVPI
jgi:hypothetical protein